MIDFSWRTPWFSRGKKGSRRVLKRLPALGQIETLEDRCLLAAFLVTNLNDSGAGSLRQAVSDANGNNNAGTVDTIRFDAALLNTSRLIALTSGQITVTQSVSIMGPSFDPEGITISGTDNSRVFEVSAGASNVTFAFLTITRGDAGPSNGGGALFNQGSNTVVDSVTLVSNSARDGGAISNTGQGLQVQRSLIASNTAVGFGGGGLFNSGTALINDTTISGNALTGMGGGGGGVATSGSTQQLQISGSTIFNNTAASAVGGGIFNFSANSNAISLDNSTITQNVALGGGGVQSNGGTANLTNVTIVGNLELSDLSGTAGGLGRLGTTVNATNLIVAQNFSPGSDDDVSSGAINGTNNNNFIGGDPRLGPLRDNGGPTFTMLPLAGSPVIDNGATTGSNLLDQRGFARAVSGTGNGARSFDQGAVEFFPTLTQPYAVGPGANTGNVAGRAFNANSPPGASRFDTQSYPGFPGEVRVALDDFNLDGTEDIVTAPGPGGGPHIRVRSGINPATILFELFAYDPQFGGGVYIATGDINGDGTPDIITGPGAGGGPHVRVFSGVNQQVLLNLFPYGGFTGGVRVASGDINNDGRADIITAPGPGGSPHVKVYNGMTVLANPNDTALIAGNLGSFFAYAPTFGGGVFVASGDVNGDGIDDLITGAGEGGGPHVLIFTNSSPTPIGNFFAYGITFAGGVRVAAVDQDGDQFADIITGAGPGAGPHVRIVSGRILTQFGVANDLASFFAYNPFFTGGLYVTGSDARANGGSPLMLDDNGMIPELPTESPTAEELGDLTTAAIARFESAGLDPTGLSKLEAATVEFADLAGSLLGLTLGNRIQIDADAAGFGFFVDPTPADDIEFLTARGDTLGRVDLLTVIIHELAHVLGLPDVSVDPDPDHILADRLPVGVRRTLSEEDLAAWHLAFDAENLDGLLI